MQALRLLLLAATVWLAGAVTAQEDACTDCHDLQDTPHIAPNITPGGAAAEAAGYPAGAGNFEESAHSGMDCTDCHTDIVDASHEDGGVAPVDCGECHDDAVTSLAQSTHHRAAELVGMTAGCQFCHGNAHLVLPSDDPDSPVSHTRLAETCGGCHANPDVVANYGINVVNPLAAYRDSVHAAAVHDGNGGPSCDNCHGSHDIFRNSNPASMINRANVPATCGACHTDITDAYLASVHGQGFLRGASDAPICTDCHGEHRILAPGSSGSPVSATNQSLLSCGGCHGNLGLNEKYGLAADKVPSYADSYHGLAAQAGKTTVASCASCHGVHDILPSSNPHSRIHPDNIGETCSDCHAGAGQRFAIGPIHVVETDRESFPIVYWIRLIYLVLIYATIGGMLVHVGLDFISKCRAPAIRAMAAAPSSGRIRMNRGFRIAHGLVMLSFPVLVWSGFALSYPNSWWAWPLIAPGPEFRGLIHRIAAVVICLSLVIHVIHLAVNREARRCMLEMVPNLEDVREFIQRFRYYLGLRKEPVHSPRIGYIEKVEYLAFWWGMIVMTLTGLLLWFSDFMLRELPAWAPAATTAVHFYEAVLASLAILIWHGYWTVFDPAVYPMDMSWLTGKSPASREWERGESPPEKKPEKKKE